MNIESNKTFTVSEDVLFQEVSGEIVLLDLASESYFGLDEVGARIWQLLGGGKELGSILESLEQEYDVSRDVLEQDVGDLLESLQEAGLIVVED